MHRLLTALALVLMVALVWPLANRAATLQPASTLRVATFNIHKGATRGGDYDLERTIEAIHRLNADVVGLQEVMRNHPGFNCDDQAALIADGLRQRSGRPWTYFHVKAWVTQKRDCMNEGRGFDVETEGVVILSASPIISSNWVRLSEGRVGVAVQVAAMPGVTIVATHLSPNADNQALRVKELGTLLPWIARQGPGILLGDLNTRPDTPELSPVYERFSDAWLDASALGRIGGVLTGSTRPGRRVSRIDYVFYTPSLLTVDRADVFDAGDMPGLGEVSDHNPVVATFTRRNTASS